MPFRRVEEPSLYSNLDALKPTNQELPEITPLKESPFSLGQLAGELTRAGAKGVSSILGFPADIAHAFLGPQQEMVERLREKVPSEGIPTPFGTLTPEKYEGPPPLSSEFYFEKIYKPLVAQGLPPNFAQAQSEIGQMLDTAAENLALGSILGGGISKQLGLGAVGGAVGKQIAKELGYGPGGQAIGGLAGGIATQSLPGLMGARGQLKAIQDAKYAAREEIGRKTFGNAAQLEEDLLNKSIHLERHKPFTSSVRKEIDERVNTIGQLIHGKKLNLMDAVEQERALNDLLYNREFDKPARKYIFDLKDSLRKFINESASPEFLKEHKEANRLWLALNGKSVISDVIENMTDYNKVLKNPLSKFVLGGLSLGTAYLSPSYIGKGLGGLGIAYGLRGVQRAMSAIAKDPHARSLYTKILADASSGKLAIASKDAIKNVGQFDKYVTQKTDKFKPSSKKRFKRIS